MTDYQIEANTRRCAGTGRTLQPGERFYSALVMEEGRLRRHDYSSEAWQGAPESTFGFWSGLVPVGGELRHARVDDDLLMECFERLSTDADPARQNFRYVVALLLLRRKRLKFEEARRGDDQEVLTLRCSRSGRLYDVVNPRLTEEEMQAVQEEVLLVLK